MIIDDDSLDEESTTLLNRNARNPVLRRRLREALRRDLNLVEMGKELGIDKQYVWYLIKRNEFTHLWIENKERRRKARPKRQKIARMRWRVTQKVLDEFEKRGFQVTRGRIADECLIENVPIAVYEPKKPFLVKSKYYTTKYFHIKSKYLSRFVVVMLPNGKWMFFWPKKNQKTLSIPEWQLNEPEVWPLKVEFRRWKASQNVEGKVSRAKRKALDNAGLSVEDTWRLLGFDEPPE